MNTLAIDIETFSDVDLKSEGVHKYVESPDFRILLFAYKFNNNKTQVIDIASGEEIPPDIFSALFDPEILKTAYNANFEITCINEYLKRQNKETLDVTQWEDTMFRASYAGFNGSLKQVAEMLELEEQKDKAGTALINKFSKPRKPTTRDKRTRVMPSDEPVAWEKFKEYCKQDVEVESAIRNKLSLIEIPKKEKDAFFLDQKIQSGGIRVDTDLVKAAQLLDQTEKKRISEKLIEITGVKNPKSGAQLKEWLSNVFGREISSVTKETVPGLIKEAKELGLNNVIEVLSLRNELNKTSLAKYNKFSEMVGKDGRIRGILQFYGAKTGRWAGRGVQVHNLPRNYLPAIDTAREILKEGDYEVLSLLYGDNLSDTASQLIRTALIPDEGNVFAIADYSAIEARVIAWLSGEEWRLEVFRTTGKIYEASASQMFKVPFEKICDKNAPEHKLRAQGKVAELALGYQGSVGAIARMDFNNAIPEKDRKRIVEQWRETSPNIVKLWKDCEGAGIEVTRQRGYSETIMIDPPIRREAQKKVNEKIVFSYSMLNDSLVVTLPSGRSLYYPFVDHSKNQWGGGIIDYLGVSQTSRRIERIKTYGGNLVENIVQAIARDCLSEALLKLDRAGFNIRFHVHDEVIIEVPEETAEDDLKEIIRIMCEPPEWAHDLPLNAEGFVTPFYMKD